MARDTGGSGRTESPSVAGKARHGAGRESDALTRLAHRAGIFGRLFFFVGLGAMLGAVIEGRRWYRLFARSLGRLTRRARLPEIVGLAVPMALASCPAADSMLVASHNRGEISASALVAGGMLNSYLAHLSHSMRVFYPVVAAIGLPGVLFFLIQFGGMACFLFLVLAWHSLRAGQTAAGTPAAGQDRDAALDRAERDIAGRDALPQAGERPAATAGGSGSPAACKSFREQAGPDWYAPLPWSDCLRKGLVRALSLLFRLASVSVPLILGMEWLIRAGALDFWDRLVPATVSRLFPEQLLTIMAAQLGGLVQSSAVSASLLAQNLITGPQVLLAMLVASAAGNPVRTLRRNLPTALAIFPARIACLIVLGMQCARFVITSTAAVLLLAWMHYALPGS